jgi:hypothetical protein
MNVFTEGDITLDIISNIDNYFIEKISGKLGSGKIGLNANYILHNKQVNYKAYANIDEVEYNVEGKSNEEIIFYNITLSDKQKEFNMKKKLGLKYFKP